MRGDIAAMTMRFCVAAFAMKGARAAAAALALLAGLSGCMPDNDSSDQGFQATFNKLSGSGEETQVNRSDKRDALLSMRSSVNELGEGLASGVRSVRRAGEQLVSLQRPAILAANRTAPLVDAEPVPASAALSEFYAALRGLESRKRGEPVTILHLGDHHIASDQLSGDLRDRFQSRFGRAGRGMMAPALFPAKGVKFDRGGRWRMLSSAEGDAGIYGLTGVKLAASGSDAWLRLTSLEGSFEWAEVTLETGPGFGSAIIAVDGEQKTVPTNSASADWKTIRLNKPGRELAVRAKGDGEIRVHSWTAGAAKPGVSYVNLGLPKATAMTPERWSSSLFTADVKRLNPNLIILSYGSVEAFDDTLNLPAYEQRILKVIAQLKIAAPDASLIIAGPPDAARMPAFASASGSGMNACRALAANEISQYSRWMRKEDNRLARWHAPPMLTEVRASLRRAAAHTGAYFWDWSKIMGGPCGIHAWVHAQPALAGADHVSLTEEGAKRSARAFLSEIMNGYGAPGPATAQKR